MPRFIEENDVRRYAQHLVTRTIKKETLTQNDYNNLDYLFDPELGTPSPEDQEQAIDQHHEKLARTSEQLFLDCFDQLLDGQRTFVYEHNRSHYPAILPEVTQLKLLREGLRVYQICLEDILQEATICTDVDLDGKSVPEDERVAKERIELAIFASINTAEQSAATHFRSLDETQRLMPIKMDIARKINIDFYIDQLNATNTVAEFKNKLQNFKQAIDVEIASLSDDMSQHQDNSLKAASKAVTIAAESLKSSQLSTPEKANGINETITFSTLKRVATVRTNANVAGLITSVLEKKGSSAVEKGRQLALLIDAGATVNAEQEDEARDYLLAAQQHDLLPSTIEAAFEFLLKEVNTQLAKQHDDDETANRHLRMIASSISLLKRGGNAETILSDLNDNLVKVNRATKRALRQITAEALTPNITSTSGNTNENASVNAILFSDNDEEASNSAVNQESIETLYALASRVNQQRKIGQNYPDLQNKKQLALELLSTYKHYLTKKEASYTYWASTKLGRVIDFQSDLTITKEKLKSLNAFEEQLLSGKIQSLEVAFDQFSTSEAITKRRNPKYDSLRESFFGKKVTASEKIMKGAKKKLSGALGHYGSLYHPGDARHPTSLPFDAVKQRQ